MAGPLRVLLIGASGVFGAYIARELAGDVRFELLLSGRRLAPLQALQAELGGATRVEPLDIDADDLLARLRALRPDLVIHAAGPFQGRDYRVAEACIAVQAHYVDLADGRDYVGAIEQLDVPARTAGCLVVSGASTVPAISAAVVDALAPRFGQLRRIEHAISPGNRAPRGDATVAAILGYCGRAVPILRDGQWRTAPGWMLTRRQHFGFGRRWVGLCDVPDLQLFPHRYPAVETVLFRAGLELKRLHFGTLALAWAVRLRCLRDLARWAPALRRASEYFLADGSDVGGMVVELSGLDQAGQPLGLRWWLTARGGDGPRIPASVAVLLARKLADGSLRGTGATPCLGLFELEEWLASLRPYRIEADCQTWCAPAQGRKRAASAGLGR